MNVTHATRDAVTVEDGRRTVTIRRTDLTAGLRTVTHPGTCTTHAVIRGIGFSETDLRMLLATIRDAR